jgi:hypothetical protein
VGALVGARVGGGKGVLIGKEAGVFVGSDESGSIRGLAPIVGTLGAMSSAGAFEGNSVGKGVG